MDHDLAPRDDRPATPDDAQLGVLVRAVADDWHRPPQRLDQAYWRERVEGGRHAVRGSGGRRWFGRLAEAGVLAVVATLVLAVTAVFLSGPGQDRGSVGTSPSTTPTEGATPSAIPGVSEVPAAASPLPAFVLDGDLPSVTSVLLQGSGGYRFADLTTGTLEPDLPWDVSGWNTPLTRPGGGWVCVCGAYSGGSGSSEQLVVTLDSVDASGEPVGSADLRTLRSEVDPAQPAKSDSLTVDVRATATPDGRFAFIGWSQRTATGWRAGVDVVDLASLVVVDALALPDVDRSAEAQGRSWVRIAPKVAVAPAGGVTLISGDWYVEDPATATPPWGTDRWSVTFTDGRLAGLTSAGLRSDDQCNEWEQGVIDQESYYVACIINGGPVRVDRYRLDGSTIDQTEVGRFTGYGAFSARPDDRLFMWDPQAHTLLSYDLRTGVSDSVTVPDTAGLQDPLDIVSALGRAVAGWIAPSAVAKILLHQALIVSPDGNTLYALGINASAIELGGSAGIFVFDISGDTPAFKAHWQPTADFVSIAVSEDGGFVYAAGMGGVDPQGHEAAGFKPSVTVFAAADGSVRLVAGQLTGNELLFVEPVVR